MPVTERFVTLPVILAVLTARPFPAALVVTAALKVPENLRFFFTLMSSKLPVSSSFPRLAKQSGL